VVSYGRSNNLGDGVLFVAGVARKKRHQDLPAIVSQNQEKIKVTRTLLVRWIWAGIDAATSSLQRPAALLGLQHLTNDISIGDKWRWRWMNSFDIAKNSHCQKESNFISFSLLRCFNHQTYIIVFKCTTHYAQHIMHWWLWYFNKSDLPKLHTIYNVSHLVRSMTKPTGLKYLQFLIHYRFTSVIRVSPSSWN